MSPNYAFKPTAGEVIRTNQPLLAGGGMMLRQACMFTAFALSCSLLSASPPVHASIPDDVARIAFESLLARPGVGAERTMCLLINGSDPSAELSALLHLPSPGLVAGSSCYYKKLSKWRDVVALTRDEKPAEFLTLSGYRHKTDGIVSVDYEFHAGSWTGHGSTLSIELRDGQWHVLPSSGYEWVE
jgi:hypothetical protein